jgi:DNA polymerase-1
MSNDKYLSILEEIKKHGGKSDTGDINDKVLIIDGLNTFIRVFSVIPTLNEDGVHIGGIVGFLKSVGYAVKLLGPTRCIIVFDGKGGSVRRRKLYPDYKANRKVKSRLNRVSNFNSHADERQNMMMQLSMVSKYLEFLPISTIAIDNIEADDTMAYITKQILNKSNNNIILMSSDKDFLQLVDDRISVWSPTKKKLYKPDNLFEEYGIPCINFLMGRVMEGDKSDNIPGVQGAGFKTIKKRFPGILDENNAFNIKDLLEFSEKNKDLLKIFRNVVASKDQLELNYKLMQLHEVDISNNAKLKINDIVRGKVPILNKPHFQLEFMKDRMFNGIPNFESWLNQSWSKLNRLAKEYNGS